MSAQFQGLVNPANGRVLVDTQGSAVRPGDAVDLRGLAVSPEGRVYCLEDAAQSRVFQNGLAFEASTGLLLLSAGSTVANISQGGLGVDANGAVVVLADTPDVIHQGVGLNKDGKLCVELNQGAVIPDGSWTIEDPTSCSISGGVITWTRTTTDSFIRLAVPGTLSPGQTWVLSYEVTIDSGVGSATDRLFISGSSSILGSTQVGTAIGNYSYEATAVAQTYLIRWTPTTTFNNQTLAIRDVRIYDKNNPGGYP